MISCFVFFFLNQFFLLLLFSVILTEIGVRKGVIGDSGSENENCNVLRRCIRIGWEMHSLIQSGAAPTLKWKTQVQQMLKRRVPALALAVAAADDDVVGVGDAADSAVGDEKQRQTLAQQLLSQVEKLSVTVDDRSLLEQLRNVANGADLVLDAAVAVSVAVDDRTAAGAAASASAVVIGRKNKKGKQVQPMKRDDEVDDDDDDDDDSCADRNENEDDKADEWVQSDTDDEEEEEEDDEEEDEAEFVDVSGDEYTPEDDDDEEYENEDRERIRKRKRKRQSDSGVDVDDDDDDDDDDAVFVSESDAVAVKEEGVVVTVSEDIVRRAVVAAMPRWCGKCS